MVNFLNVEGKIRWFFFIIFTSILYYILVGCMEERVDKISELFRIREVKQEESKEIIIFKYL